MLALCGMPSQSKPYGFASSPEGRALGIAQCTAGFPLRSVNADLPTVQGVNHSVKTSHFGGGGSACALTERVSPVEV